jgi:hypothetical protein
MKSIHITIRGVTPLLHNRFTEAAEASVSNAGRRTLNGGKGTPREQAEPKCYRDHDGRFIIPGPNLFRAIIDAGKFNKSGKSKLTTQKSSMIPSFCSVETLECLLTDHAGVPLKEFEVDSRAVVIPATGGRIMAHRPRFDEWQTSFVLSLDTDECDEQLMRRIIDDAGGKIGLGDFRPDRKGPFGKFQVNHWQ